MRIRLAYARSIIALLLLLAAGCGRQVTEPSQEILGRWEVVRTQGMSIPHSFFWFMMDYVEFRDNGTVLGLVAWPPDGGAEIRLNVMAEYSVLDDHQVAFVGACRYEDPCTGVYSVTLSGDALQIVNEDAELGLRRVGPPSETLPPTIVGPSASPTPGVSE